MARVNFTVPRVQAFTCPPGKAQAFLWDTDTVQLGLRATPNGRPAFVFQSTIDGKTIRITIGDARDWPIPTARAKARELQRQIDEGQDPREVKRQREEAADVERQRHEAAKVSALAVWGEYCTDRSNAWGERHYTEHVKYAAKGGEPKRRGRGVTMPGPLYDLLDRPLSALTAAAVEAWAKRHATERPTAARLALRMLKAFVRWCSEHPTYEVAVADHATAAVKSRKAREILGPGKAKTDCLQREQLAAWFTSTRQETPAIAAFLQVLLLTGARPGEILTLGWGDVDFQWRSLTIRDKVEGERIIPLTPYVAALLDVLPRRGPYVFMSGRAEGCIASPNHQALRVCKVAGIPPVTLHGLRRSFGTLAEWVEVPAGIVAQLMGHKPSATAEKHYRARPLDLLRLWHTRIEAWILEQAGTEQPATESAEQRLRAV